MVMYILLLITILCSCTIQSISTITFYIRPYFSLDSNDTKKILDNLKQPTRIVSKSIRNHLDPKTNQGIFSSYWGYLTVSDLLGQIWFPRKQQNEKLKILVTEQIIPVLMIGNTIHHWTIDPKVPVQLFSIERINKEKKFYWQVQEVPMTENPRIQLDTIIIFAKPKDIVVPIGLFPTTDNQQLVLPDIYAKKTLNRISPALSLLRMRQFFGPMKTESKKFSETYFSEQLIP